MQFNAYLGDFLLQTVGQGGKLDVHSAHSLIKTQHLQKKKIEGVKEESQSQIKASLPKTPIGLANKPSQTVH